MVNILIKSELFFDLVNGLIGPKTEQAVLNKNIPIILRKLNCVLACVLKFENDTYQEMYTLPKVIQKDDSWDTIKTRCINQINQTAENCIEFQYENKYYYTFRINNYGLLILGRKFIFDHIFQNEFQLVINFFGNSLNQIIEKQQRIIAEKSILKKQKMLQGIALATDELLQNPKLSDAITKSLQILGQAVDVDRTYIFENSSYSSKEITSSLKFEWCSTNVESQIHNLDLQNLPLSKFESVISRLENKKPFSANISELNIESEVKSILQDHHIKSILNIPIFQESHFWGFIGYDDCTQNRNWSEDEILLLKSFGNSLAGAIKIHETSQKLKSMALFPLENPDPVVRLDLHGNILIENEPAIKLRTIEKSTFQSTDSIHDIYKKVVENLNPIQNSFITEFNIHNQNYKLVSRLSKDNDHINIYFNNISKLKKAEKRLIASNNIIKLQEEKYRNIISHMDLGLLEIDNLGSIQFCNLSFSKMSGYPISQIQGKNISDIHIWSDEFNSIEKRNKIADQASGNEFQIINKSNETKWWLTSIAKNYNDHNDSVGTILICLDITEQKQLELDLEKAVKLSQDAARAKELFLANMSHEIRTPLNGIIGMIRELNKGEVLQSQKGYINSAIKASRHLLSVVNNILDITKIETGEFNLTEVHFKMKNLLQDLMVILEPNANAKNIQLHLSSNTQINNIYFGDEARIRQILINLVGNAIKFTDQGSVNINCNTDVNNPEHIIFSIKDTGIGMDDSYVKNAFQKFQQEDSSISRKFGGTGLGLYITKELVDLMKGKISINSIKGKGTEINVELKLPIGNENLIKSKNITKEDSSIRPCNVLLVEDNEMNRLVASFALQNKNIQVTEAQNGKEAVELVKNESFDLILMDLQMPIMNGIEATKIIRQELMKTTPIIALTANAFKSDLEMILDIGMNDYLTKPFEEYDLLQMVSKYVHENKIEQDSPPLYDLSGLKKLSRGNTSFEKKMLDLFTSNCPDYISDFNTMNQDNNFEGIKKLAHKIKPTLRELRIQSIENEILELESFDINVTSKTQLFELIQIVNSTLVLVTEQITKEEL
jgi:PAS domain S-box-containing protein